LRLAEDYAVADYLTGGRVLFGVGRGYHTREVETFDAPMLDGNANRELFEEQVEVMLTAFNQRAFRHAGKHYTLPPRVPYRGYEVSDLTLVPRPKTLPVECWQPIVSASPRGLEFMARHGIKGVIGGGAAVGGAADKTVRAWQEALARSGREGPLGMDLCIGISFHMADTEEQAIREATPFFEEYMKMFAPLGFMPYLSDEQVRATYDPGARQRVALPTLPEAVAGGSWMVGPPERIRDHLLELQDRYPGLEMVHVGQVVSTPRSVILEQLEWFAREVMPTFKKQQAPVRAGALAD
jgi:alkanesulfonate monooxygenase SsuD/methylene tetrahydromethanopterin reductase-like flavin-dependent oxidoreductase (luciferase family)